MKTGTFLCWLFGHKFLDYREEFSTKEGFGAIKIITPIKIDYCCRCGIKEPKCPSN